MSWGLEHLLISRVRELKFVPSLITLLYARVLPYHHDILLKVRVNGLWWVTGYPLQAFSYAL